VLRPYPGGEVGDLARVDLLPYVLAGLLVVLAGGALALTLIGSVRRHRRDLAILKTIGFVRGHVFATVAWRATALAVSALVVGLPCGVALGRGTWDLAAGVGSVSPRSCRWRACSPSARPRSWWPPPRRRPRLGRRAHPSGGGPPVRVTAVASSRRGPALPTNDVLAAPLNLGRARHAPTRRACYFIRGLPHRCPPHAQLVGHAI